MKPREDICRRCSGDGSGRRQILSFDVEEYFQVEAAGSVVPRKDWPAFGKRLDGCVDRILTMLAEHGSSATFFVLGWVARHEPQVVRRIVRAGHEIASHGMDHRMIHLLGRDELRRDLADSKSVLEDLAGRQVIGYRAPTFSVTHSTAWAIDAIVEAGFRYDSSVFPVHHDRYGVPGAPPWPHVAVSPNGQRILEVPPLTVRRLGVNWPVGGGGYFRLLPLWVTARAIDSAARSGRHAMLYLHPWELDPGQPVLAMPRMVRWRHRLNLSRTEGKLRRLLEKYRFAGVADCFDTIRRDANDAYFYGTALAGLRRSELSDLREKSNASGVS
jgi:polysaccharide deacetylase family protein (PEP-CTERM system associated)